MYQTQSNSVLFRPVMPQAQTITQNYTTQSFINQAPQPTQFITTQSYVPPQPQVQTIIPQTQTFVPQVQQIVPQVQTVVPAQSMVTSFVPIAQAPMVAPYVPPVGSRLPLAQTHMSQVSNNTFVNIGGSPYGRISMIK